MQVRRVVCHSHATEISLRKSLPADLQEAFGRLQRHATLTQDLASWLFQGLVSEGKKKRVCVAECIQFLERAGIMFAIDGNAGAGRPAGWLAPCVLGGGRQRATDVAFCKIAPPPPRPLCM